LKLQKCVNSTLYNGCGGKYGAVATERHGVYNFSQKLRRWVNVKRLRKALKYTISSTYKILQPTRLGVDLNVGRRCETESFTINSGISLENIFLIEFLQGKIWEKMELSMLSSHLCVMCELEEESISHLICTCKFVGKI